MHAQYDWMGKVSIHAPRTGRDRVKDELCLINNEFQSTRPARGATSKPKRKPRISPFQSTRPARGATMML